MALSSICGMALITLAMICLLACSFFVYVLVQWTRDENPKAAGPQPRTEETGGRSEKRQPRLITFRHIEKKKEHLLLRSSGPSSVTRQSKRRLLVCSRCERIAHEKIARALILGRQL